MYRNPLQRWPDRGGYRTAERMSDVAMMPADEVLDSTLNWLWSDVIPIGHVTLIAGEPNSGTSFWVADLAARVTSGQGWPDRNHHAQRDEIENPKSKTKTWCAPVSCCANFATWPTTTSGMT